MVVGVLDCRLSIVDYRSRPAFRASDAQKKAAAHIAAELWSCSAPMLSIVVFEQAQPHRVAEHCFLSNAQPHRFLSIAF